MVDPETIAKFKMTPEEIREEDEDRGDTMAFMVLDEFPIETINKILAEEDNHLYLCLADQHADLPEKVHRKASSGTSPDVDAGWRSPFLGKTVQDAVDWMRNIPKSKSVNRKYCAVLKKDLYERHRRVLVCKYLEGAEPQTLPWDADDIGSFLHLFEREKWDEYYGGE